MTVHILLFQRHVADRVKATAAMKSLNKNGTFNSLIWLESVVVVPVFSVVVESVVVESVVVESVVVESAVVESVVVESVVGVVPSFPREKKLQFYLESKMTMLWIASNKTLFDVRPIMIFILKHSINNLNPVVTTNFYKNIKYYQYY